MTEYKDWFAFDSQKQASRVRGLLFGHVLKELLANSLDAGATSTTLNCEPADASRKDRAGNRAFTVECRDNGGGCCDPEILRRVGSTTSDQSASKRGRFGRGLIDVISICERAEIRTLGHRLAFQPGRCVISAIRNHEAGLAFEGLLRHPGAEEAELKRFFESIILPEGVEFEFNGVRVPHRETFRTAANVRLPTPLLDPKTETVRSQRMPTEVGLVAKFGETPMIYELGIPVDDAPWSLPYDINVMQKTPLDIDRNMLPDKYKAQVVAELVEPSSDLYEELTRKEGKAPPEIADKPDNAKRLSESAQTAIVEAHLKTSRDLILRRNPLDDDDLSESQELEGRGYLPVNRGHLPSGLSALLEDCPTVHKTHDEKCKALSRSTDSFPKETARQAACLRVFGEIASALVGSPVRCERIQGEGFEGAWQDGDLGLNIDVPFLWDNPLGEKALGVLVHECAHANVSGHCPAFEMESAQLGARLAIWVAKNPGRWVQFCQDLGALDLTAAAQAPAGGNAL
jgi:hypothetical protein